jgi:short-subunit dehydrogenase
MSYALITGASGGIGLSIAEELAKKGYNLLLVARSEDRLESIKTNLSKKYSIEVHWLGADLSSVGSHLELLNWITANDWRLTVLVNNAGYGLWKSVEKSSLDELQNIMQLNMNALVNICHSFIPTLKKNSPSFILNIASTASYQAVPYLSTYAATKAFVVLFSRGLRWELKESNVSVTTVSPGATSTGFIDRAEMGLLKEKAEKFSMTPEEVARISVAGMFAGKTEVIPGFANWISVKLTYLLPKQLVEKIALGLYKKK